VMRYIEYSLSASVMMVSIACVLTVYDFFTHILVFTCTFLCMHLGLVADYLRFLEMSLTDLHEGMEQNSDKLSDIDHLTGNAENCKKAVQKLKWFTHALSWVAIMVPYLCFVFVVYMFTANNEWTCLSGMTNGPEMPGWVHGIVVGQFILFSIFGLVQVTQFCSNTRSGDFDKDKKRIEVIGIRTEYSFVLLSLIAKTMLGWLIAYNVIF
jgi:hypothetical protein